MAGKTPNDPLNHALRGSITALLGAQNPHIACLCFGFCAPGALCLTLSMTFSEDS